MAQPKAHPLVTDLAEALAQASTVPSITTGTARAIAQSADLPELMTFVGFLGGTIQQPGGTDWRVLYVDWNLTDWLLVEEDAILLAQKVKDEQVPSGERDVIWVKAEASVGRGSGSPSVEARFLSGEFTRAGDFEAAPTGGTLSAATGVFCEANTAACCWKRTRP